MSSHHPYLNSSHQLFRSPSPHGCSKAQICFFKILHIISSVPPSHRSAPHSPPTGGIAIDLNLRFCSVAEDAEFRGSAENGSDSSAIEANGGGERSVEVEVDDDGVDDREAEIEEEIREEKEGNEEEEERGAENEYNCLDLLIEAAKVISGKEESKIEERTRSEAKERWMVVNLFSDNLEKSPAVVRTKRGRSQALPYRFRDSVMEPLKRRGRPSTPSSTAASRKRLIDS